ncbi:MAG: peptide ABC transporter substrate-binding protein [Candidatus Lumbricidophila eiseniae]|uniref:Peptide ABC transporter substrate-binding protein n=1 Tax=Candidatus Lumbricidiphila eiseniae TaxID=1969409 RepID=A0A2A6FU09_9MICO|nr:MAG: peptide ABC transporter substrate-binding protein [Candidatus Lumbricidophila eiseniae]
MTKRILSTVALGLAAVLGVSACGTNANSTSAAKKTDASLTVAHSEGGKTLDPAEANDGTSDTLVIAAYDQLVTYEKKVVNGKPVAKTETIVPMLAESWKADKAGTTYTFTLRKDVTFHNGKKMTSDDVVRSFKHIADSASASFLYKMAGIVSVTANGENSVVITLKNTNHLFLQILPMYSFSIIDMDAADKAGDPKWLAKNTAGTGPYVVDSWDPATEAKLARNDKYWGTAPAIKTVNMKFIGDASNRLQLLKKGSVDLALELAPKDVETLKDSSGVVIDSRPSNKILFFAMNNKVPPFDNPKVRQAISYAIPYDKLLTDVMKGQATRMKSAVASSTPGFVTTGYTATYDLAQAKKLLAEAGLATGFSFTFTLGSGFPDWNDDAVLIQAELAKIGVTMNIQNMARAQFLEALAGKNVQSYISRWTSFVNDPGYHLGLLLTSTGTSNYANYTNPQLDALWTKAATEQDAAARNTLYEKAQLLINQDSPWAYLYEYNIVVAQRSTVDGYTSYPDALIRYAQLNKKNT